MYSNSLVCNILTYLKNNINKEITIDELSSIFFYNRAYIMKSFKREIGITILDYINSIRIFNSLKYYKEDKSILNIALNNGFQSIEYYSEIFKKYMGVSPRVYKYFISYNPNLSIEEEKEIRSSLTKLIILNSKVEKYINNMKPIDSPVKKIFLK